MAQERNSPNPLTNIPSLNDGKQNPVMGGRSYMGFDGKQYYGSNFDGTTYASTNPNTSTPIVTPVPAPATPVAAPVAAAIAPDPVSPPPVVVTPERDGQDISSPMPKKEELVAGPPAPITRAQTPVSLTFNDMPRVTSYEEVVQSPALVGAAPGTSKGLGKNEFAKIVGNFGKQKSENLSSYTLDQPPVNADGKFSQQYIEKEKNGSRVVYNPDGTAVMIDKYGKKANGNYYVENGEIKLYQGK
jgi:hypothetical protein